MFEIKNLIKRYPSGLALNEVSMEIQEGLNFIVGASGSGKTTLLKIMCGLETDYEGNVLVDGIQLKELNEKEKSFYYNSVFGFIWQDFNLLEEATVMENVMLPIHLKENIQESEIKKLLRKVKLGEFADKKVKHLSGGQKQRVAIVRELLKNPSVMIADEPTSALDRESSEIIMSLFHELAKTKTVIIVTHDLSLIKDDACVFELDKGELISGRGSKQKEEIVRPAFIKKQNLSMNDAAHLAMMNIKNQLPKFMLLVLSLLVSTTFLLVSLSGAINKQSDQAFDQLLATYGDSLMDITLSGSFMSASGGKSDEPKADVTQDIRGLYDQYLTDERVQYVLIAQAFNDIQVEIEGIEHEIQASSNVPILNQLLVGNYPTGNENEVVVTESFAKTFGFTQEEAIGKKIQFEATVYNWSSGEPLKVPVSIEATIVGIANSDVTGEREGQSYKYTIEDSFFFSKNANDEMRKQAGLDGDTANLVIRANSMEDLISLKDELNANGIVPLGQFELVEDMVRLNQQSSSQSSLANKIMGMLAFFLFLAISFFSTSMRKREYAIYRICGYNKQQIRNVTMMENILVVIFSGVTFACTSWIISKWTLSLFQLDVMASQYSMYLYAILLISGIMSALVNIHISTSTKVIKALKTGGQS